MTTNATGSTGSQQLTRSRSALRTAAYVVALIVAAVFAWLLNDLRLQLRRTSATVNEKLPSILEKTERSAAALAELSEDVRQLRDLAGATGPRDATLAAYADAILDRVEASGATIGTRAKLTGKLADAQPAAEWVAAARKEALWLTFRAKSRQELLTRLTETKFGGDWHLQLPGDAGPRPLREWVESQTDLRPATDEAR